MIVYTHDADFVLKKWSTWLSIIAASLFSGCMVYNQLPAAFIEAMPHWFQSAMGIAAVVSAVLVPFATSVQQKSIPTVQPESVYPTYSSEEMP